MKVNLVEISLIELRDFISIIESNFKIELGHFSLISLKLRLQFLISEYHFTTFPSFYTHFMQDEVFRKTILSRIVVQPNELYRDADDWEVFGNELSKINSANKLKIALFESGNFAETITFIICLKRFKLLDKCELSIVDLNNRSSLPLLIPFTLKEYELGETNFSGLRNQEKFSDFFTKKESVFNFSIPSEIKINFIKQGELLNYKESFDAVVARNITLNYNFEVHQKLYNSYLNILEKGGLLYVGNKENFSWCAGFDLFSRSVKSKSISHKK